MGFSRIKLNKNTDDIKLFLQTKLYLGVIRKQRFQVFFKSNFIKTN